MVRKSLIGSRRGAYPNYLHCCWETMTGLIYNESEEGLVLEVENQFCLAHNILLGSPLEVQEAFAALGYFGLPVLQEAVYCFATEWDRTRGTVWGRLFRLFYRPVGLVAGRVVIAPQHLEAIAMMLLGTLRYSVQKFRRLYHAVARMGLHPAMATMERILQADALDDMKFYWYARKVLQTVSPTGV